MSWIVSIRSRLWLCLVPFLAHAQAFAFGIDDLEALIRTQKLTSIDEVIARLPAEYKESYTLAYESQSLQGSSYDDPRAILFGRTARFMMTFNGDSGQRHYSSIEAMQFREETESFELYSIDFDGGPPAFSGPNPQVCMSCHGSPPHPIWSSYEYGERETSHWPGFYGSTHDAPMQVPEEKAAFERFRERAADHPRYRHLVLEKVDAPWFPYGTGPLQHELRPNNRLGNLLARWHARQIVSLVRQSGFIESHPRVAQAWLLQCPGTAQTPYRQRVRALFEARFPPAGNRHVHEVLDGLPAGRRTSFMMEKLLTGSPFFGWDMSIEKPEISGRFYTGIVTIDSLVGARWMATLETDHWLRPYFEPWGSRELYNTFEQGYYELNVAPGGVGQAYDQVASYYDQASAHLACPDVMRDVLAAANPG